MIYNCRHLQQKESEVVKENVGSEKERGKRKVRCYRVNEKKME